jgi:hypothetical protein
MWLRKLPVRRFSELVKTHRREKLEVDAGGTTVLITIFDPSRRRWALWWR